MFCKVIVNGFKVDLFFVFLKEKLLYFIGEGGEILMKDSQAILWSLVRRFDVFWNFEKFLIDVNGVLFKRYSRYFFIFKIKFDIDEFLVKK